MNWFSWAGVVWEIGMYTSTEHFDDPFQVKRKISCHWRKAAIASSIFNINEPVMYGLPVVLNPVMMLGYMTVSFVVPTITYIVFKLGLVSIPAVAMMMNFLPQPISTFMVNSDFRGIILWAVLFVLTYLIYLPFFKVYEKQELESEQEVNTLRKEETNG